ncbi:MAG: FlgD immunoglobulin-like domain containing protein [Chloroflexota bacterium]
MRNIAVVICAALAALTATVAQAADPVAAATTQPKVAIIVGATEATTVTYRADADEAYAEARKYTSNVVKVYSPNATWAAVKAATKGASIVVYIGHGNGFPSPYRDSLYEYSQDGFGLNADNNGDGKLSDYEKKYYGAYYIRNELTLAPNAVVLLYHLCYASGSSEPGLTAATLSQAKQRVDNYASGFLAAGAAAVVADGHISDHGYYIRKLFTTHDTIERIWRTAPTFQNHVSTYASSRTAGATYLLDPGSTAGSYYHALTGNLRVTADQVTGAGSAPTNVDPAGLTVPGAASVGAAGAPVFGDAAGEASGAHPTTTLPADTRLRLDQVVGTARDGSKLYAVHTLDDATSGVVAGSTLVPRDSAAPKVVATNDGAGAFSPNGDGVQDAYALAVRFSEAADWSLRFENAAGTTLASRHGSGTTASVTWGGTSSVVGGAVVPDGTYSWFISATDGWGNGPVTARGTLVLDTVAPKLANIAIAAAAIPPTFSPNGDGYYDTIGVAYNTNEAGSVDMTVRNSGGAVVRTTSTAVGAGTGSLSWDGRTGAGATAPDGIYAVALRGRDRAGNTGNTVKLPVGVYNALAGLRAASPVFFPHDGDSYAQRISLSFTLASAATVTWTITDAAGLVVATPKASAALAAGTYSWIWDGKAADGHVLPRGTYYSAVRATNGTLFAFRRVSFVSDAFRITSSDTTPARGQKVTITAISAEPLGGPPKLTVIQPGVTPYSAGMALVTGRTYRVSVTLRAGSTGTIRFKVTGVDAAGQTQLSNLLLPLH